MVIVTRSLLQVDSVVVVLEHFGIAQLKRDSERPSGSERTIRVERVAQVVLLQARSQASGTVRTDGDYRKAELGQLRFDFAQLSELRIAIGSPAPAVEDEQGTGIPHCFRKIDGRTSNGVNRRRGHRRSRCQRLDRLCARIGQIRRPGCAGAQ